MAQLVFDTFKRVLAYFRVSTEHQEDNNSLRSQLDLFHKDRERYGWSRDIEPIQETGSGTSIQDRPGIKQVLRAVESREVDAILVFDPDRLCRPENLRDLAEIYEYFVDSDVKLLTPSRIYDLSVDNDVFSFDIEGVLAKHNRRRLLQNMNRGRLAKAREGRNAGGSAPEGYLVDPKTDFYVFDPERLDVARLSWTLVLEGRTLRDLVKEYDRLGIRSRTGKKWSMTHFHDMFYNQEYLGKYIYGKTRSIKDRKSGRVKIVKVPQKEWIIVENAHPPLVTPEVFYAVQSKLAERRRRTNHNTHMLTAIVRCYVCGSPMHVKYGGGGGNWRRPKYVCIKRAGGGCTMPRIGLNELNDKVWEKVKGILADPDLLVRLATPLQNVDQKQADLRDRGSKIRENIARHEQKKARLLDLYLEGSFPKGELDEKNGNLSRAIQQLKYDLAAIEAAIKALVEQPNSVVDVVKYLKILHYSEAMLTYDQKVKIFRQLVYKVSLTPSLDFDLELYRKPNTDMPDKFRAFPKNLGLKLPVQDSVADGLGDMFGLDVVGSSQVTQCSGNLQ